MVKSWHYFDLVKRVKFGVSRHLPENAWKEWPETLYVDVSWPQSELISCESWSIDFFFKFWHYFDLVKQVKVGVSRHMPGNAWGEWPEFVHVAASWPPSDPITLWSRSVDFSNFGLILTWISESGQIGGLPGICRRTHGGNCLTVCMLLYPGHLQNWSGYGNILLMFLILALFWLVSNLVFPAILVMLFGFSSLWCPFDWN